MLKNVFVYSLTLSIFFQCILSLELMGEENRAILKLRSINKEITIVKKKVGDWEKQLFATLEGVSQPLISNAYIDFEVLDINQDGDDELLVSSSIGGNGNPPQVLIYYYKDSEELLTKFIFGGWFAWAGWDDVKIQSINKSAILTGVKGYSASPTLKHRSISYFFDGDSIFLHSITNKDELPALVGIRSTNFDENNIDSKLETSFDLNSDGIADTISCGYWPRWGDLIDCTVNISIWGEIPVEFKPKRLGVLNSKKNGVNMLVLDHDTILVFDPSKKEFVKL